jgi:DNA-binding NarL/FixJ family response regulator
MQQPVRTVVIVEDHTLLAETLQTALRRRAIEAVIVPCDAPDLPARILAAAPDLVLLDLDLGTERDGNDVLVPLVAAGVRVLVVTGTADPMRIAVALERGAVGYERKESGFEALLGRACAALDGRPVIDQSERWRMLRELARTRAERERAFEPFERLTERERDVLEALAEGRSVRDMADQWVVSDATVRSHVHGLLSKLGESSQLGAVVAALRSGWLHRDRRTRSRS